MALNSLLKNEAGLIESKSSKYRLIKSKAVCSGIKEKPSRFLLGLFIIKKKEAQMSFFLTSATIMAIKRYIYLKCST